MPNVKKNLKNVVTWPKNIIGTTRNLFMDLELRVQGNLIISASDMEGVWASKYPYSVPNNNILLTVELFELKRFDALPNKVVHDITVHLSARNNYKNKSMIWWVHKKISSKRDLLELESETSINISELFRKINVYFGQTLINPSYVVVLSTNILGRDITTEDSNTGRQRLTNQSSLEGQINPAVEYNLRDQPTENSNIVGRLNGDSVYVSILKKELEKHEDDFRTWYNIKLKNNLVVDKNGGPITLKKGTELWCVKGALAGIAAPWSLFVDNMLKWEREYGTSSIRDSITTLRQHSHDSKLPFDEVIGTKRGDFYMESIVKTSESWQMFVDYNAVIAPDDRWVDLHHLFVGLDVLHEPNRMVYSNELNLGGDELGDFLFNLALERVVVKVGESWDAATWAGDVGSAVADYYHEDRKKPLHFYLKNQAPYSDLLGNLDAWGIYFIIPHKHQISQTITGWLISYYETTIEASNSYGFTIIKGRIDAINKFVNYLDSKPSPMLGDSKDGSLKNKSSVLRNNRSNRVYNSVNLFASIWLFYRKQIDFYENLNLNININTFNQTVSPSVSFEKSDLEEAMLYFLNWLRGEVELHKM